ncbi:MAG: response regulator [bacterium]|nr:response regulator [bacterium]
MPLRLIAGKNFNGDKNTGNITFRHLSMEDGLSQGTVRDIIQDRRGFMWFGTQNGLNRYDGYEFTVYKYSPGEPGSLSNNFIHSLCEDRRGMIWIGTKNGGLNRFDPATLKFTRFLHEPGNPDSLSHNVVNDIYEDSRGILWIGTMDGLNRWDRQTSTFTCNRNRKGVTNSLSDNDVLTIAEDRAGNLWIGTGSDGLNRFDPLTGTFARFPKLLEVPDVLGGKRVASIDFDSKGALYLGTGFGLIRFDPVTGDILRYRNSPDNPRSLTENWIHTVFWDGSQSGEQYLWVGTENGLNRLNGAAGEIRRLRDFPDVPESLGEKWIYSLYKDRSGNLWIGTGADGIYRIDHTAYGFVNYLKGSHTPPRLLNSAVYAIRRQRRGILWFGTDNGVVRFDRDKNQYTHYRHEAGNPGSLSYDEVTSLHLDRDERLWIGTYGGGLNRLDLQTGNPRQSFVHYRHEPGNLRSLVSDNVNCISGDHTGVIWVGTQGGGVCRLDTGAGGPSPAVTFTRYRHDQRDPSSISGNNICDIYTDRSGTIWVSTEYGGLNRLDTATGKFTRYTHDPGDPGSISHQYVQGIMEDREGVLWTGTMGGGLNRLGPGRKSFTHFTEADGLSNNVVYGILEDDNGNLWLSTDRGISHFNPKTGEFKNYDRSCGLQADMFSFGAFYKSSSGEMFFGGVQGANSFFPGDITVNRKAPPVVITGFQLFNKPVPIGKGPGDRIILEKSITETQTVTLRQSDKILSFQFAALNYIFPGKNRYAYMMEGIEDQWNEVGNRRFATYVNLSHGEYRFRVKASNNDGIWNEKGTAIHVIIVPPFWQTWWFRWILIFSGLGLVYLIVKIRVRAVDKNREELKQMVVQRTQELQMQREIAEKEREIADEANMAKGQFLARMSHEIRTPMNAVIGFTDMMIDSGLREDQQDYAQSIQQGGESLLILINDILDFSRIEAGQMSFDPIDFDPEITMFDICDLVAPKITDKPVDIICRIGEGLPAFVKSDPGRFRQVVLNLMGNAVKFTETGEIHLSLHVEDQEVERLKLHVTVRDTGIGIPGEKLGAIFEMFQQADGSTTRKYGGTGLGLTISRQIARLMEGEVWAESEPGKGSTFHFTAWVEKSSREGPLQTVSPSLTDKKILLVDGNRDNLDIHGHLLEKAGVRVTGTMDGEQVVETLQAARDEGEPYDLCILAIHIPGKSGFDVLEEIRHLEPPLSNLPVMAFTSYPGGQTDRFKGAGFDGFLSRPVHSQKLYQMIARLLEKEGTRGEAKEGVNGKPQGKVPIVTRYTLKEEAKHSVRILMAEDHPVNRKLARFMLTKAGYRMECVNNGKEAVEVYTAAPERFDMILMDVQMPVMDGLQATGEIRKWEKENGITGENAPRIPIIAITADVMKGDRERFLDADMDDFIPKPIKREVIFQMVKKWTVNPG